MLTSSSFIVHGDLTLLSSTRAISTITPSSKFVIRASGGLSSDPDSEELNANVPKIRFLKPRKVKISRWSKGDGPGEYGGPPAYIEPRKSWGGDNSDPLTTKNDFIWNKEWKSFVQVLPAEPPKVESPKQDQAAGFLSLNRAMALDSLEVDLSQELMKPSVSIIKQQVEAARFGISTDETMRMDKPRWRAAPTTREQQKWERASKATTGGTGMLMRNVNRNRDDPAVIAAQSREQYIWLKQRLQLITLTLGGLGIVSAYLSYSPEVATSFGAGFLGSLAYIRMLGNSVDSYGKQGVKGAARRVLGQPRLLVPVILVMMYNRWNG
ncbi:hypothetical protein KI387_037220, partial [Taxus chinensis]